MPLCNFCPIYQIYDFLDNTVETTRWITKKRNTEIKGIQIFQFLYFEYFKCSFYRNSINFLKRICPFNRKNGYLLKPKNEICIWYTKEPNSKCVCHPVGNLNGFNDISACIFSLAYLHWMLSNNIKKDWLNNKIVHLSFRLFFLSREYKNDLNNWIVSSSFIVRVSFSLVESI